MTWVSNLWNKNKLLFFLALPVVLLFVFKDVIISILISGTRDLLDAARRRDTQISSDINELDKEAAKAKERADNARDNINNRDVEDIPDDWHTQ